MVWSFALVRRPSSRRIAARTESPSWTRDARREGCGWGKWVISSIALWHDAMLCNRLLRPLVRIPCWKPRPMASRAHGKKHLRGVNRTVNVPQYNHLRNPRLDRRLSIDHLDLDF